MYVPNYIPEPLEVPGNITQDPYIERVLFIRSVTWTYGLSVTLSAAIGFIPHRHFNPLVNGLALTLLLILLDIIRIMLRGQPREGVWSTALLPVILVLVGWEAQGLNLDGVPTWGILFSVASIVLYTLVCGRDYSFVGCYFLSLIVSSVAIAGLSVYLGFPAITVAKALLVNFVYLSYTVYDLASLLARRRKNEVLASVTDLYRDVFNFFGYFYRCLQHWKKHQIWVAPK